MNNFKPHTKLYQVYACLLDWPRERDYLIHKIWGKPNNKEIEECYQKSLRNIISKLRKAGFQITTTKIGCKLYYQLHNRDTADDTMLNAKSCLAVGNAEESTSPMGDVTY